MVLNMLRELQPYLLVGSPEHPPCLCGRGNKPCKQCEEEKAADLANEESNHEPL